MEAEFYKLGAYIIHSHCGEGLTQNWTQATGWKYRCPQCHIDFPEEYIKVVLMLFPDKDKDGAALVEKTKYSVKVTRLEDII